MNRSHKELINACLYIDEGEHTYRIQLDRPKTLIGTSRECDVLLRDKHLQELAGEFIATRRGFEFRANDSQEVSLNDHPIRGNQRLYHGDVLTLGTTRVRYFEVPEVSDVTLQISIAGLQSGHSFFLTNQSFVRIGQTIGELRIPDGTLDDPQVAIENLGPNATYIRQLGTEKETVVNGVKLSERTSLQDGAIVQMGETHLVIRTLANRALPAPSEILLHHAKSNDPEAEEDTKRTAPEELPIIQKARIRSGSDVVHSSSAKPATPSREVATFENIKPEASETLANLRKAPQENLSQPRKNIPTPQPYTIRQSDLHKARRQKDTQGSDLPYYLQDENNRKSSIVPSSSAKPFQIQGEENEKKARNTSQKVTSLTDGLAEKPYYVPAPRPAKRVTERNSPLDWMQDRTPNMENAQDGSTIIFPRDAVDNEMTPNQRYVVPEGELQKRVPKRQKDDKESLDRSGTTLQDAAVDELD